MKIINQITLAFMRSVNLFYSRNIGIASGESVRIYGGARLTGRIGRWDIEQEHIT